MNTGFKRRVTPQRSFLIAGIAALAWTFSIAVVAQAGGPGVADTDVAIDQEIDALKTRIEKLESERAEERDSNRRELKKLKDKVARVGEGDKSQTDFLITGFAQTGFRDSEGSDGSFAFGSFNPILLARYRDRVLFESEIEFEVGENIDGVAETETTIGYMQVDYIVNDYLTAIAGRFILPLGTFSEKTHPAWINKMPNGPLPYAGHDSGLLPFNDLGLQARGAIPIGNTRVTYAAFVANGPSVATETAPAASTALGSAQNLAGVGPQLEFNSNISDNNSDKSFGGRLGFIPIPGVELGISGMKGAYDDAGNYDFSTLVLDAALQHSGFVDLRGEWIDTNQETDDGDIGRSGFWVQGAVKLGGIPSEPFQDALDNVPFLRRFEPVLRYSEINSDVQGDDRDQLSMGLNIYLTNTLLVKASYDSNDGDDEHGKYDAFNAQVAYGF